VVVTFAVPVTLTSAQVSSGTGSVAVAIASGSQVFINLTGVTNAQIITVSLANVTDSAGNSSGAIAATMAILLGDVNGSGVVSNVDVALTKAQVAAPVTSSNFRNDVNANGVISNTDVSATKAQVGTSLP